MAYGERKEFELTEAQYEWLLTKRGPEMLIGGHSTGDMVQLSANAKWMKLGDFMGFDGMSVKPDHAGRRRFFTAQTKEPILAVDPSTSPPPPELATTTGDVKAPDKDEEPKSTTSGKFRLSFLGPATSNKWKTDDVPPYHTREEAIEAGIARLLNESGGLGLEEFKVLEEVAAYGKRVRVEDLTATS